MSRDKTLDASAVRARHRGIALRLLWQRRELSRADLARITGLSRSTVSAIVSELIEQRLVSETGAGTSRGGRRPIILGFNYGACVLAGVDVGANHVAVALTDLRCDVLAWRHRSHHVRDDPKGTLELLRGMLDDALDEVQGSRERLVGIGLGVPSPVVPNEANGLSSLVLPRWVGHDIRGTLENAYHRPVFMSNDANLGALAELWWGAGRGEKNLVFIKLATGIGAGLIINGEVYRGTNGIAGEIAHTSVDPEGPTCVCGQRGCLGAITGSYGLVERVAQRRAEFPDTELIGDDIGAPELAAAALRGDALAIETIEYAGHFLGIGIAGFLNVVDPGLVVLGGELTQAGALLTRPLLAEVRKRAISTSIAPTRIVVSPLGERDIALGAATQVLQAAQEDERLLLRARQPTGRARGTEEVSTAGGPVCA